MLIRLPMLCAVTIGALVFFRPTPGSFGNGEDLALSGAWVVAVAVTLWLLVLSTCCAVALRRGRVRTARRCAALLPGMLRRGLELAIVTSAVLASAVPAHAITDEPIVRTPHAASTPTSATPPTTEGTTPPSARARPAPATAPSTTPPPTSTTAPTRERAPEPVADVPQPEVEAPRSVPPRPRPRPVGATYVVQPGDNLWVIAERTLVQAQRPTTELVAYWHAVIEANTSTLRSGDPNLIYPGEVLTLPVLAQIRNRYGTNMRQKLRGF